MEEVATNSTLVPPEDPTYPDDLWAAIVLLLMSLVGFSGNLISFLVYKVKPVKNVADYFAIYLSFSDTNENVVAFLVAIWTLIAGEWPWNRDIVELLWRFWSIQTWLLAGGLAVNRYFAVILPFKYSYIFTKRRVVRLFLAIGSAAFLLVLPGIIVGFTPSIPDNLPGNRDYDAVLGLLLVALLSTVMVFCYYNIITRMKELQDSTTTRRPTLVPNGQTGMEECIDDTFIDWTRANRSRTRRGATILEVPLSVPEDTRSTMTRALDSVSVSASTLASSTTRQLERVATKTTSLIRESFTMDSTRRTETMFLWICVTFVCCSLPYQIYNGIAAFVELPGEVDTKVFLLLVQQINFLMNPYFYYHYNRIFATTVNTWLTCQRKNRTQSTGYSKI